MNVSQINATNFGNAKALQKTANLTNRKFLQKVSSLKNLNGPKEIKRQEELLRVV